MFFRNSKEIEIRDSSMHLNKEGRINDVSSKFMVMCKNYVSYYQDGQITLIHKKGSLHNILSCRPVSLFSNLNKVFENIIYNRSQSCCRTSNFIAKNQFGFRKNLNTELAALTFTDELLHVLEYKKMCYLFLLDYSACFDTLSRSILYDTLSRSILYDTLSRSIFYDTLSVNTL